MRVIGQVQLRRCRNERTGREELHIDHADPTTMVVTDILGEAYFQPNHPWVSLRRPEEGHGSSDHAAGEYGCQSFAGDVCFHNSVLTITATNRTVIYLIRDYVPEHDAWTAVWPD